MATPSTLSSSLRGLDNLVQLPVVFPAEIQYNQRNWILVEHPVIRNRNTRQLKAWDYGDDYIPCRQSRATRPALSTSPMQPGHVINSLAQQVDFASSEAPQEEVWNYIP